MLPSLAAPYVYGSATSRAAAQRAVTVMPLRRKEVYVAILLADGAGRTDEEVAELTGIDLNTIRPRRGELARDGWIRNVGTRKTRSGCQAVVWVANEIPRAGRPAETAETRVAPCALQPAREPRRDGAFCGVAQPAEQVAVNALVAGSSPAPTATEQIDFEALLAGLKGER